jgi:hypothetical protein
MGGTKMERDKLYRLLAQTVDAYHTCVKRDNIEWRDRHEETIGTLTEEFMPSGSGIDNGTTFDFDKSNGEKLVFSFDYHHMNENGMYDGWTNHVLTVRPSLVFGFTLSFSGRDRNDIKEYLYQEYEHALSQTIQWDKETEAYFSLELREAQKEYQKTIER